MWQPIETAPRDRVWIIGGRAGWECSVQLVRWNGRSWAMPCGEVFSDNWLTHWQPLPEPPLHNANSLAIT
jgi:hypothetical protein